MSLDSNDNSREHHWWPVALQYHWSTLRKVHELHHDGRVVSKVYDRRKIARKSHGHTIVLDQELWRQNFEGAFAKADESIHDVVEACQKLCRMSELARIVLRAGKRRFTRRLDLSDLSQSISISRSLRNDLFHLCLSLMIRSPANRFSLERVGSMFNLPPNEQVGKMNMLNQARAMNESLAAGFSSNIYPILIASLTRDFIFGDGFLETFTLGAGQGFRSGHSLVPLTPNICIFFSTPFSVRADRNARLLFAPNWVVDEINSITELYSRDVIFFSSKKPEVSEKFALNEYRCLKGHQNALVSTLLKMCGEPRQSRFSLT
jgi:hypothetical protein